VSGRRRAAPRKRRAPWWARLSLVFGVVLVILSGGSLATGAIVLHQVNSSVQQDDLLGTSRHQHGSEVKGPLDMLLAGSDLRNSWKSTGKLPRTDTIMWLHIPASHDRAYLTSIARDLVVDIPAYPPSGFTGATERINGSFPAGMKNINDVSGGMKLLAKTVSQVTGAQFDMAGLVNWDGFMDITRALGGVTLCLAKGFTSTQPGFTEKKITFPGGCHHYDANKALLLVRQRDNFADTDYGRQQIQQQFVKQILKQATSKGVVTNPGKLNSIIKAAGKSITLDLGGYSVVNLALALNGISSNDIVTLQPPHAPLYDGNTYEGESLQQPMADDMFKALRDDTIDNFLVQHPSVVSKNVPTPGQ
jgi:polyisoprenyl-teichoic acid--peptidoglycan teichoic acid transferase